MDIWKKQILSLLFWRRYSATFVRINRNPLNKNLLPRTKQFGYSQTGRISGLTYIIKFYRIYQLIISSSASIKAILFVSE